MRAEATLLILGAVFVASVINQLPIRAWHVLVARFDRSTFLPFWGFFGPKPAYAGIHVVYRDRGASGWSGWTEIDIPPTDGWRWIWNPARHERKALHDLVNGLAFLIAEAQNDTQIVLSNCHLALVSWVVAQPHVAPDAHCRQFALVEATGHGAARQIRPVFTSETFSLG